MELTIKDAVDLSLDCGNFPDVIPVDYGLDLVLKTKPNYIVSTKNPRKVRIEISSYRGIATGAIHYYAAIKADGITISEVKEDSTTIHGGYICAEYAQICQKNRGKYDGVYTIEVMRKLTKEEIENDPRRWGNYKPGDNTNAFYTKFEALKQAIEIVKLRFGKGWVLDLQERITL